MGVGYRPANPAVRRFLAFVSSRWSSAALLLVVVLLSAQLWSLILSAMRPAPQHIVSIAMLQNPTPGRLVDFQGHYVKRRDCPGTWTIRLRDSDGVWHTLGDGPTGANPPGAYAYATKLLIPTSTATGPAILSEVQAVICSDVTHVERVEVPVTVSKAG